MKRVDIPVNTNGTFGRSSPLMYGLFKAVLDVNTIKKLYHKVNFFYQDWRSYETKDILSIPGADLAHAEYKKQGISP
jgi:ribosomal protein S9